jgi:hypothetical protein
MDKLLAGVAQHTTATATAAVATATKTAPGAASGRRLHLQGFIISASAAPGAAVEATITGLEDGTITIQIPAAAFAPIVVNFGSSPLRGSAATNLVLNVPSLGGSVKCTATLITKTN